MEDALVSASPRIEVTARPSCHDCEPAYDEETGEALVNDFGSGTNDVKECQNCTLASAQVIAWGGGQSYVYDSYSRLLRAAIL